MALMFENFGVRRVEIDVLMWPGFDHGFKPGELSRLYGALNEDDLFESAELRANLGAEFESEHWRYDISANRIRIRSDAFASFQELDRQMVQLLVETKKFFKPRRLPYLTLDRALVQGVVPDDKGKDVTDILRTKVLASRLRQGSQGNRATDVLPGTFAGTGLTLVGDADDYHWHAHIGPAHSPEAELRLGAEIWFWTPREPPEDALISDRLETAYNFVKEHVLQFAETALS